MNARIIFILFLVAGCCLVCYFTIVKIFLLPEIVPHIGDGVFKNTSLRNSFYAIPGYQIDLPQFDVSEDREAEYHVTNLAEVGEKCYVGITIQHPKDGDSFRLVPGAAPRISIKVTGKEESSVVDISGDITSLSMSVSSRSHCFYYQLGKSFVPKKSEEYTIRLSYRGDHRLSGYKGFVCLKCGGHK